MAVSSPPGISTDEESNMKINRQPYSALLDFEKENNLSLIVNERSFNYVKELGEDCRFYAEFEHAEVKDGAILIGRFGDGATVEEALLDYMKKISGQLLIVDAYGPARQEIQVPEWSDLNRARNTERLWVSTDTAF
jgi:hypothetical protein